MTNELVARARAWNEAHPDRVRAIRAKYRAAHREVARAYYEKNRDLTLARVKADRAANPWKRRAYRAHMSAVGRAALCGCCSDGQRTAVYRSAPPGTHVVHVRALALGGKHCVHNLRVIPRDSNSDLIA